MNINNTFAWAKVVTQHILHKENMLGLWIVWINEQFVHICISKVICFNFLFPSYICIVSFDVLHCYGLTPSHAQSRQSCPLEGAPCSWMSLAGLCEGGFCLEDMTCLKRQCHCDASGLHLCTLSLFFRKVTCFAVCCRERQSSCL